MVFILENCVCEKHARLYWMAYPCLTKQILMTFCVEDVELKEKKFSTSGNIHIFPQRSVKQKTGQSEYSYVQT